MQPEKSIDRFNEMNIVDKIKNLDVCDEYLQS